MRHGGKPEEAIGIQTSRTDEPLEGCPVRRRKKGTDPGSTKDLSSTTACEESDYPLSDHRREEDICRKTRRLKDHRNQSPREEAHREARGEDSGKACG